MTDAIIVILLLMVVVFALGGAKKRLKGGCCGGGSKPKKVKPKNTNTSHYTYKVTVYIDGMTCDHCKAHVENAFNSLTDCYAKVNLKKKCAEIWTNKKMNDAEISGIVKKNGYSLTGVSWE